MIDFASATFGCELEIADADTSIVLPPGNTWCDKDGSIANSNGTGNDPKHQLNRYGGEIQVRPRQSPEELLYEVLEIYTLLGRVSFNYTTNLHVHIRVPGLRDDLYALKNIADYVHRYGKSMYQLIDPNHVPASREYPDSKALTGAMKRYKRRERSHHYMLAQHTVQAMMAARTVDYFVRSMIPHNDEGRPLTHLFTRPGVNLASLWRHDTIEFRFFTMSHDPNKLLSAFQWPLLMLEAVFMTNDPPARLLDEHPELVFQKFHPYDYDMDKIFQLTNLYHNTRRVAKHNYEKLIEDGVLTREELGI